MGFRIMNNVAALNSLNNLNRSTTMMNSSLQKLSSGYRINSSADDAAGMASSMRFRAEITSLQRASQNAQEGSSLLQVAEGAMGQIDLILKRMKELATQAASGNAGVDRDKIDAEAQALKSEIDRITGFTEYNGVVLLDGNYGAVALSNVSGALTSANGVEEVNVDSAAGTTEYAYSMSAASEQITLTANVNGSTISQTLDFSAANGMGTNEELTLNFNALGVKLTVNDAFYTPATDGTITTGTIETGALDDGVFQIGDKGAGHAHAADSRIGFGLEELSTSNINNGSALTVDLTTQTAAQQMLSDLDTSISTLAEKRGDVGALINRFSYAQSNLAVSIENKVASESVIRDVDMAAEMSEFTKNQILVQAGTSMLAQANLVPQNVLSLLG